MIVATHLGLFMPALRPNVEKLEIDEPQLQIRSRRRIDLDRLREYMHGKGLELGETIHLKNTDYQFRAYTTRHDWGTALYDLAMDINYTKFKDTPEKYHGDNALTSCYTAMWGVIFDKFPSGSSYDFKRHVPTKNRRVSTKRPSDIDVTDGWSTYRRRETVEWRRMSDLSDRELALLMREIDDPTDDDLREIEDWGIDSRLSSLAAPLLTNYREPGPLQTSDGSLNHAWCDHAKTKSARRKCRERWLLEQRQRDRQT